jgi:hypothetical protein
MDTDRNVDISDNTSSEDEFPPQDFSNGGKHPLLDLPIRFEVYGWIDRNTIGSQKNRHILISTRYMPDDVRQKFENIVCICLCGKPYHPIRKERSGLAIYATGCRDASGPHARICKLCGDGIHHNCNWNDLAKIWMDTVYDFVKDLNNENDN